MNFTATLLVALFYINYGVRASGNNRMLCLSDFRGYRSAATRKPQVWQDVNAVEQMLDLYARRCHWRLVGVSKVPFVLFRPGRYRAAVFGWFIDGTLAPATNRHPWRDIEGRRARPFRTHASHATEWFCQPCIIDDWIPYSGVDRGLKGVKPPAKHQVPGLGLDHDCANIPWNF